MSDKTKHFLVCAAISVTACAISAILGTGPAQTAAAGLMCGVSAGAGKEYGDRCAPGNRWDWADMAFDIAGAVAGAAVGAAFPLIG